MSTVRVCELQWAVAKWTVSDSAVKAHNPQRCQSSLSRATDDLYHTQPFFFISALRFFLLFFFVPVILYVCLSLTILLHLSVYLSIIFSLVPCHSF